MWPNKVRVKAQNELQERIVHEVKVIMDREKRWAWPTMQEVGVAYCTGVQSGCREQLQQTGGS